MSPRSERLYRGLLLAYPSRYRLRFADEILGVLMEAEEQKAGPRRGRPSVGEAVALVRHGLAMRMRIRGEPGTWRRPVAGAAGLLVTLVAAMGTQPVLHLADRFVLHHDWRYADPLWLASLLALLTWAFFVRRWQLPAALTAWAAVACGVWTQRHLISGVGSWGSPQPGARSYADEASLAVTGNAQQIALLVPGIVLAMLLLRPGIVARSAEIFQPHRLIRTLLIAVVAIAWTDYVGISQTWPILLAGLLLIPALVREGLVLRAGLLIAFAFGYLLAGPQADGSGSRLPRHGWPLAISLGVIPILLLLAGIVLVSQLEASASIRQKWGDRLEALGRSVRGGTDADDPEPVHPV